LARYARALPEEGIRGPRRWLQRAVGWRIQAALAMEFDKEVDKLDALNRFGDDAHS
jgi:hypothetical protein